MKHATILVILFTLVFWVGCGTTSHSSKILPGRPSDELNAKSGQEHPRPNPPESPVASPRAANNPLEFFGQPPAGVDVACKTSVKGQDKVQKFEPSDFYEYNYTLRVLKVIGGEVTKFELRDVKLRYGGRSKLTRGGVFARMTFTRASNGQWSAMETINGRTTPFNPHTENIFHLFIKGLWNKKRHPPTGAKPGHEWTSWGDLMFYHFGSGMFNPTTNKIRSIPLKLTLKKRETNEVVIDLAMDKENGFF